MNLTSSGVRVKGNIGVNQCKQGLDYLIASDFLTSFEEVIMNILCPLHSASVYTTYPFPIMLHLPDSEPKRNSSEDSNVKNRYAGKRAEQEYGTFRKHNLPQI